MRNRKPNQNISLKYFLTRKKYNNLHKRITGLIKDGSFCYLTEKIRKNMWRRLHLLYRRLLKLISRTTLTTAALTAAFIMLTNTTNAQTFSEQTGTNNPFNSVDVGDQSSPTFVDIDGDGDMDAFIGEDLGTIKYYKNTGTNLSPTFTEQTGTNNPFNGVDIDTKSIPTFVDIDGDGDMDAFIGEHYGNINYYKNTGTVLAPTFTEQTGTNNPFNGVDVGVRSTPTFVDIDGDGDMDAFVGENENGGTINYYKNTGTALAPTFTEQTGTNNPLNSVAVGFMAAPTFADIDSDGDMDSFIGENVGNINYYKNTGTALAPSFTEQTGTNNPFNGVDVGANSKPAFVDIDGDGDRDAFIGESLGAIKYYKNTSSLHTASFALMGTDNPFNGVDVGTFSAPSFVDIDSDGDMDSFIGEYDGIINYFKNTGTVLAPTMTEQTGTNNPFNGVDVGLHSKPTFADLDSDGDMDTFIGENGGTIKYYKNTGTALAPAFTEQTGTNNPLNGVNVGSSFKPKPILVDIDGDGDIDIFIGQVYGLMKYYKNTGTALAPVFTEQTGTNNPLNSADVGEWANPTFADVDGDGDMDAYIGENLGTIKYYKNTGTALAPAFTEQTGTNNPFNGVDVGGRSSPSFADLDGDGDFDAFIGEDGATIKVYADGTNALPVQLTSFNAFVQDNSVVLNWNTATEVNNYGFEIERDRLRPSKTDFAETSWEMLGFVPGNGTSNIPHIYSFIDKNTLGGLKFNYRLKQIDVDGKFEYSDVLTVTVNTPKSAELMQNSPNPFNPSTSIKFFIPTDADVTIKIYDLIGREVQTLINEQTKAGFHIVFWNGRNSRGTLSASGVYFYRLTTNNGFVQTKKMALLK